MEFAFKHVLIRDVAYATLPKALGGSSTARWRAHLEAALADPAGFAWLLAHHWREAGDIDAARELPARGRRARQGRARGGGDVRPLHASARPRHDRRGPPPDPAPPCARARASSRYNERGDKELAGLLPELDGVDEIEALLARGRATLWTEQTEETFSLSERALDLVRARGPAELEALALTRLAQALRHAWGRRRSRPGDRAGRPGYRAMAGRGAAPRARRALPHARERPVLVRAYERALEYSQRPPRPAGSSRRSAEFLLRGAGRAALILSSLGRYEEAVAAGGPAIETAGRMGRPRTS